MSSDHRSVRFESRRLLDCRARPVVCPSGWVDRGRLACDRTLWPESLHAGAAGYRVDGPGRGCVLAPDPGTAVTAGPSLRSSCRFSEHRGGLARWLCRASTTSADHRAPQGRVAVLLAAGIGVQLGHIAAIWPNGFNRVVRRTLPVVAGLFALGTAFVVGSQRLAERRAILARPDAPRGKPNVLLIVWDTVRGQNLSAYGYDRPTTPFLTSLSQEGARFARAVSTAPWTLPSHGSIFTGQWPYMFFRGSWKPIETPTPTIATVLGDAGYATAGFTANPFYTSPSHRIDQGFQHYEEYGHGLSTAFARARLGYVLEHAEWFRELTKHDDLFDRKSADDVSRAFLHWVDAQGETPFFVFLNFYDAHRPYVAPSPFRERFARGKRPDESERAGAIRREEDAEDWYQDEYDGLIAYLDDATRRLLEELDRRGVLDNTVVIITADHGDQFGEHGKWFHMNSLYRVLLEVPWWCATPVASRMTP